MDNEYFEKYGYPLFYDSLEEYDMTEQRAYKEVLASVETHIVYINNHLGNIDSHLEKQNTRLDKHGNRLTAIETVTIKPVNLSKKQAVSMGGSLIVFGSFAAGAVSFLSQLLGWW